MNNFRINTTPEQGKSQPPHQEVAEAFISLSKALNELNVNSQEEITELPSDCYRKIAAVK